MPTQPAGPKNTQTTGTGTKTGDPTNAAVPAVAGGIALAGIIVVRADANNTEDTPLFKRVLGEAVNFGIVANHYEQANDLQSNFATNKYSKIDNHGIHSDLTGQGNHAGNYWITSTDANLINFTGNLDSEYYVTDSVASSINDKSKIHIVSEDQLRANVNSLINTALKNGENLAKQSATASVKPFFREADKYTDYTKATLDTTGINADVIYVDGDRAANYPVLDNNGNVSYYENYLENGNLTITKKANQTIVFNFTGNTKNSTNKLTLGRLAVKDQNNNDVKPLDQTEHIIYNVQTTKYSNIDQSELNAVLLVNNRDVRIIGTGTSQGWIVTNGFFSNVRGEWHNIYPGTENITPNTTTTPTEKTGSLKLTKTFNGIDDASKIDLSKIKFEVKGTDSRTSSIDKKDISLTNNNGTYSAKIENLPLGEYEVTETNADISGYKLKTTYRVGSTETQKVSLTSSNNDATVAITNDYAKKEQPTTLNVSKTDLTSQKEVSGAKITVYDENNKVVDSWTSGGSEHDLGSKLKAGSNYTIKEDGAPAGYNYINTINLSVGKDGKMTVTGTQGNFTYDAKTGKLIIQDQKLETKIDKTNITGDKEVPGATIEVVDKTADKTVDTWTSDGKGPHDIGSKLKAGHTYTLKETSAPTGYAYTTDVTFKVDKDGTIKDANGKTIDNKTVLVKDEALALKVSKTDLTSQKEVSGAKITVYDENNKVVDSWTSGGSEHDLGSKLKAGSNYTIKEDGAPAGYNYINTINLSVGKDGKMTVTGTQGNFTYDAKTGKLIIQDQKLETKIDKTNITGDKEVPGATIEVVDKTADKTVDTWTSDGKGPHDIGSKLEAGHTYTLKETSAPTGYAYTTDVTFKVDKDGTIKDANDKTIDNKIVLVKDEALALKVSKTDLTSGKEVSGAKITVYDENNKVVDSWTSDGSEHDFGSKLTAGSNYMIKEDGAPAGYNYINTINLSVGKDGRMTVTGTEGDFKYDAKTGKLTIQDKKLKNRVYSLKMRKTENVDEKDTDKRISGSRYAMYKWTGQAASAKKRMALRAFAVKAAAASTTNLDTQFKNLTRADITEANDWKEIVSSDTDANGEIKADSASNPDITPGVYAFMEQTPPAGYQRTKNPAVIRLKEDGTKEMISDANGAAVLETEGTGDAAVQFLRWRETATNVEIAKVDENGNPVKGAIMAVYDKDGKLIDSWTTDGTAHRITAKLIAGDTYT